MLRPTYPLESERLLLRPYTPDDLDAFHAIVARADVNRYLYSEPRNRGQAREVLARLSFKTGIDDEHDDLLLAVIAKASRGIIGHVTLEHASREHRQGELIKGEWCDELVYAMLASEWRDRGTVEGT